MSESYFIRESKSRNYTTMDNTFLKDVRLSWKAKGVFAYILSLPENWKIHVEELMHHAQDGETALRSAIKELTDLGYIVKKQSRRDAGKFGDSVYIIIENPTNVENQTVIRDAGNPDAVQRETVNRPLINTNTQNTNIKQAGKQLVTVPKQSKAMEWTNHKVNILEKYKFDKKVHLLLLQFLGTLAETNTLLADISIQAQFDSLKKLSDENKLIAVQNTITRGWKSLDYAITDVSKSPPRYFDTAQNSENQLRSEEERQVANAQLKNTDETF